MFVGGAGGRCVLWYILMFVGGAGGRCVLPYILMFVGEGAGGRCGEKHAADSTELGPSASSGGTGTGEYIGLLI